MSESIARLVRGLPAHRVRAVIFGSLAVTLLPWVVQLVVDPPTQAGGAPYWVTLDLAEAGTLALAAYGEWTQNSGRSAAFLTAGGLLLLDALSDVSTALGTDALGGALAMLLVELPLAAWCLELGISGLQELERQALAQPLR